MAFILLLKLGVGEEVFEAIDWVTTNNDRNDTTDGLTCPPKLRPTFVWITGGYSPHYKVLTKLGLFNTQKFLRKSWLHNHDVINYLSNTKFTTTTDSRYRERERHKE